MELFVKIVNNFKLFIIFTKISITDVCLGSEYTCIKALPDFNGLEQTGYQLQPLKFHLETSRPEVFCKNGVLRNIAKFTEKHLCQSLFFIKAVGLRPSTLLKNELWHSCFPVKFVKFIRTPF